MPVGRGSEVNSMKVNTFVRQKSCPPSPLPTGILFSPKFRLHQESKMVAHQTQ